jgi:hypothetical protein
MLNLKDLSRKELEKFANEAFQHLRMVSWSRNSFSDDRLTFSPERDPVVDYMHRNAARFVNAWDK